MNQFGVQTFPVADVPQSSNLAPLVSAGGYQPGYNTPNGNGSIPQTERLFTVRSRGAFENQNAGGDRGTRAYIKLLTTNTGASLNRQSGHNEGLGASPVLTGSGSPLSDAIYGGQFGGYADFLVTAIRCSLDEKLQITETFGDGEVMYYFGRQPIAFNISGVLVDSVDNDWFTKWMTMYGQVMRGSQLARNYELLRIVLPNMEIVGTIPHMSYVQDSSNDTLINFEFQFLAKQVIPTPVSVPGAPMSNMANLINWNTADSFLSQSGINGVKSQVDAVRRAVQSPGATVGGIAASLSNLGAGLSGAVLGGNGRGGTGATDSALSRGIDSVSNAVSSVTSNVTDVFNSVSANLAGIRASLFSPIYGVLSSLTKLVQNVTGSVAAIFNSLVSPIADIIRDVVNISNQAMGIVNMVNSIIDNPWSMLGLNSGVLGAPNMRTILGSLLNTRGIITNQPTSMALTMRGMMNLGQLPANARFLRNTGKPSLSRSIGNASSKSALLNSGPAPSPQAGAML